MKKVILTMNSDSKDSFKVSSDVLYYKDANDTQYDFRSISGYLKADLDESFKIDYPNPTEPNPESWDGLS